MQSGSQSRPNRMTTNRSSSDMMAWSTCQPVTRWGSTTEPIVVDDGGCVDNNDLLAVMVCLGCCEKEAMGRLKRLDDGRPASQDRASGRGKAQP